MDTNFTLNLFVVSILLIIYCFRERDIKLENFENKDNKNNKDNKDNETNKNNKNNKNNKDNKDNETNESNNANNKIKQLSAIYSEKTTLESSKKIPKLQKQTEQALEKANKEAEADLKKIQPPKKKSKKKDNNSTIPEAKHYINKLNKKNEFMNTNEIINSESINSRENNPAKNLPMPQNLNTTYYGLFNKYNLPPSSRPNIIDVFESTSGNETTQQNIGGEGNIFLPKLYM
tara:strand:+ start:159 stop:854 length:696 start_codon:yes stop_codon:yes gene_type:complete